MLYLRLLFSLLLLSLPVLSQAGQPLIHPIVATIACEDLFTNKAISGLIRAPHFSGFTPTTTNRITINGKSGLIFSSEYAKPGFGINVEFMIGASPDFFNKPFFAQYGYGYEAKLKPVKIHSFMEPSFSDFGDTDAHKAFSLKVPDVDTLNLISSALASIDADFETGMTFIAVLEKPDEFGFSLLLSKKQVAVMSYSENGYRAFSQAKKSNAGMDDGALFYHDRTVHGPFWLLSTPAVAKNLSIKHSFLHAVHELAVKNGNLKLEKEIYAAIYYETVLTDYTTAAIPESMFYILKKSKGVDFTAAIESVKADPSHLEIKEPDLKAGISFEQAAISQLYYLTRSASSLVRRNADGRLHLQYENPNLNGFGNNNHQSQYIDTDLNAIASTEEIAFIEDWLAKNPASAEPTIDQLPAIYAKMFKRLDSPAHITFSATHAATP